MKRCLNVTIADNFFKRFIGLMFKKNINYNIFFPKCNAIHTFFVKENIDVIILNKNYKVLETIENIPKNKIIKFNYKRLNCGVLEVPSRLKLNFKVGDTIIFKYDK